MTTAALSPEGALRWLGSLSIDLQATAVIDASGAVLAGDAGLGARAAAALAAVAPDAPAGAGGPAPSAVRDGDLLAVRAGGHAVAATLGPHALAGVSRCDLAAAAAALEGT